MHRRRNFSPHSSPICRTFSSVCWPTFSLDDYLCPSPRKGKSFRRLNRRSGQTTALETPGAIFAGGPLRRYALKCLLVVLGECRSDLHASGAMEPKFHLSGEQVNAGLADR